MSVRRVNFTLPEEVHRKLCNLVKERKRSSFVTQAVREKLDDLERKELERELARGYIECREENLALNKEWEAITLENWPPYTED